MTGFFVTWSGLIDACGEGRKAIEARIATVKLRR